MGVGEMDHNKSRSKDNMGLFVGQVAAQSHPAYSWLGPAMAAKEVLTVDVRVRPRPTGPIYSQSLEVAKVLQDYIRPGLIVDCYA
jgi:hypothetical protein